MDALETRTFSNSAKRLAMRRDFDLKISGSSSEINELVSNAAVVVLGMHRSGTSSVAGALVRLGGAPPLNLMGPQPTNERGFWESNVITALNEEVLAAGGSDWRDWRRFDCGRIDGPTAVALRARAKAALLSEFGEAQLPILKDPRTVPAHAVLVSSVSGCRMVPPSGSAIEIAARSRPVAQKA